MAVLAALWGSSYMFIKIAIDGGLPDTFVVWMRCLLGALVLAPIAIRRGAIPVVRQNLGWLALIAILQMAAPFLLITAGEHHVPSSLAGILIAGAPIWTAIIVLFTARDERLGRVGIAGVLLGIVGVGFLFGVDLTGDSDAVLGGAGILLAGLGYASGAVLAKRRIPHVPPVGVAAAIMAFTVLYLLPALPWGLPAEALGVGTVGAMLVLGPACTGVAFLIYYMLNTDVGPSRASVVAYIAPVFSVVYGVTLLDESFTVGTAAGLVLILAGSWPAVDGRVPRRRRATALA
jgi:drug/metabolite transporter (DMT)-like permease